MSEIELKKRIESLEKRVCELETIIVKTKETKKEKINREPSKYNKFVKEQLASMKISNPDMNHNERFKKCAELWKSKKDNDNC
uniref:YABBY protein C-terminal domain-containing protein n=1 Tax=viral metagenome TaxID=1070528 RepID=A0A6C0F8V1_9ZZZZ|tara:strand:- start:28677 stop:28925 length:249 start_codon:yes stop_codon:yes gene_type:complete